jgi:dephospho-CoA kinase
MKTVGLTGGIGSGKSTAASILAELGAHVIDADKIGHEVYRPGTAGWNQVVQSFGASIVADDGTIDRKELGSIVFADRRQLERLNSIVHPLIRAAVFERINDRWKQGASDPVVVEAAVLIEAKWFELVDEVWVVVADRERVIERVEQARGLDRAAVEARIDAQLSNEERAYYAAVTIDNSGSTEELRAAIEILWAERLA